jgi:hypothetical protein
MSLRKLTGCIATLTLALLALGCGGSGSGGSTSGATTNQAKTQFIALADAVCVKANARLTPVEEHLEAISPAAPGSDGPAEFRHAEKIVHEAIDELAAIPVPKGDEAAVGKIIHALDTTANTLADEATASAKHDAVGLFKASHAQTRSDAVYKRLTRAYGLKKCGSSS